MKYIGHSPQITRILLQTYVNSKKNRKHKFPVKGINPIFNISRLILSARFYEQGRQE